MDSIYVTPEHELLREQVARFVAREVEPHALAWEEAGMTPRAVLKRLGAAGLLGLMYSATPVSVPPVPTPDTRISTCPSVSFQISGPVVSR